MPIHYQSMKDEWILNHIGFRRTSHSHMKICSQRQFIHSLWSASLTISFAQKSLFHLSKYYNLYCTYVVTYAMYESRIQQSSKQQSIETLFHFSLSLSIHPCLTDYIHWCEFHEGKKENSFDFKSVNHALKVNFPQQPKVSQFSLSYCEKVFGESLITNSVVESNAKLPTETAMHT